MEERLREQFGVGVPLARLDVVVLDFPHIKRESLELFVSEARRQTGLGAGDDVLERTVRDVQFPCDLAERPRFFGTDSFRMPQTFA